MGEAKRRLRERHMQQLGMQVAGQFDMALTSAINERLGRTDWKPEEVRDRVTAVMRKGETHDTYCLDGVPILLAWPIELSGVGERMTVSRRLEMVPTNGA
jgi:hypothetical protein